MINFLYKSKEELMNIIKYLSSHWRRFLGIALVFLVAICSLKIFNASEINYENDVQVIEVWGITLQNWSTWLGMVGVIFAALWAMIQYDKKMAISQQEKAYEVARIFSDKLLDDMTIVGEVFTRYEKFKEFFEKVDEDKLKRFDRYEMISIVDDKKIFEKYDEIYKSEEVDVFFRELVKKMFPNKKINENIKFCFFVTDTMNSFEAIAINISSNAAGVEYIYPSLHQAILPFIKTISFNISKYNGNYTYKYFINTIEVYNNWKSIRSLELQKEEREKEKIRKMKERYGKKIDKCQKKLNNKLDKALEKKPRKI